jgi:hypothetical protein
MKHAAVQVCFRLLLMQAILPHLHLDLAPLEVIIQARQEAPVAALAPRLRHQLLALRADLGAEGEVSVGRVPRPCVALRVRVA